MVSTTNIGDAEAQPTSGANDTIEMPGTDPDSSIPSTHSAALTNGASASCGNEVIGKLMEEHDQLIRAFDDFYQDGVVDDENLRDWLQGYASRLQDVRQHATRLWSGDEDVCGIDRPVPTSEEYDHCFFKLLFHMLSQCRPDLVPEGLSKFFELKNEPTRQ